jgi:type I restriction enzyme S subunit
MTPWGPRPLDWPIVQWRAFARRAGKPVTVTDSARAKQVTVKVKHLGVVERRLKPNRQREILSPNQIEVRAGQFIISKIDARNGACGFIPTDLDGAIVTQDFPVYEIDQSVVDLRYFDHVIGTERFWQLCEQVSDGTTNRVRLRLDLFDLLGFPLPPLPEQRAIAAVLDAIDAAIEKTEQVIAATEALRRALVQDLLSRGLPGRHSEYKHVPGVGSIPADWRVLTLGEVVHDIEAGHSPMNGSRPARPDEWGVLKVSSVSWGEFKPEENKVITDAADVDPSVEVKAGDILISRANTPELVGRAVLVNCTRPRLMLSDKTLRLHPKQSAVFDDFLHLVLNCEAVRNQIVASSSGSSRSMYNVSQHSLRSVKLPIPDQTEQREIVALLTSASNTNSCDKTRLDMLRVLKSTASDGLLSGRIRVMAVT